MSEVYFPPKIFPLVPTMMGAPQEDSELKQTVKKLNL